MGERHREQESAEDDDGGLLTYVEWEVLDAFRAMAFTFLTHAIPQEERDRVSGQLLINLEASYAAMGPPPPEWLTLLQAYFLELAPEASASQPEVRHE